MNTKGKLVTLVLAPLLGAGIVWGSIMGSISGTVTDVSGGVVPGATVIALNTETGVKNSIQTNTQGFYSFPALPVGHYTVQIQARGFKEYRQTALVLDVNSALRVDATLQVGTVTQQVEVSAAVVHVETSNTQLGEIIGTNKMTILPLDGRSYTDLLALQPGVVPVSGTFNSGSVSGNLDSGNLSVSGQRETANGFMVNGGNVDENANMGAAIIPNLDSIAEFRILTSNADAEYGNYAGGLVNVITKSGTDQFHGNVFEFVRNPHLDARNFFSPSRAVYHQNQFGGTVGGPIRHDRVFFFADYQGTRMVQGVDTGLIPVPSAENRNGTMGAQAFGTISGTPGNLTFTPNTVNGGAWANILAQELGYPVQAGEPYSLYDPNSNTNLCTSSAQCVFPNGVIPQSAFSAPANPLMKYIPLPNLGPYFTTSAYKETLYDNKGSGRIDANTRLGMVSGYYFLDDYSLINPYGGASLPGFSASNNGRNQMVNFALTKSSGPSSVNEFRLHYRRDVRFAGAPSGGLGVSLSSQGFVVGPNTPGIVPLAPQMEGVMPIAFNSYNIGASAAISRRYSNVYQAIDNFSKVIGTHTVKFGGSTHYDQYYFMYSYMANGWFGFDGVETGSDFADFLIGAPDGYAQGEILPFYSRGRYYGLYGQDSWRATGNLTLNYGGRWEVSTPWWEAHNEFEGLVPGLQSKVFPGAPTGWVFPGDPGVPTTLAPTRYNNFAPRIGFAYSPDAKGGFLGRLLGGSGKTSIRGAFGVYFTAFEDQTGLQTVGDAPYGFWWSSPTPPLFTTPFIDRATGYNEGQRFPAPVPPLNAGPSNPDNSINWALFEPISSSPAFFHDNRLPYAEHYNFSIQRQFGTATLLSLSYVGTQGHRLLASLESNPGNPALCLSVSQPSQVMPGTAYCGPFAENGVFYPITGGVINGTRSPFGNAFGSNNWYATMANSNYNAFEATLRHSVGRLEFLAGYTFSKSLDNSSAYGGYVDPFDYKNSKALSAFDATHNFVASYTYRIPFDKLWRPNRLTDGWVISGITRFCTGLPVGLAETDDHSLIGSTSTDEPNFIPGSLHITDPRKADPATGTNPYFNTSLFFKEAIGQLGNANRAFFHGPGLNNWDMALVKELRLTESKTLQIRAEWFSIFNHAQFGGPDGNIIDSTFGFVTSAGGQRIGQVAIKLNF